jgi:transposase
MERISLMTGPVIGFSRVLGCDVGKEEIVVFDKASGRISRLANRAQALESFAASLDAGCFVVCEATGGYELPLLAALLAAGVPAHRADARKVKAFIRSFGTLGKTDAIDARALARYAAERGRELPVWRARHELRLKLQAFVLARRDLVADQLAYRNRREAPGAAPLHDHYDRLLREFKARIEALDAEIQALIEGCQPIADAVKALLAIPGIGRKTAAALIALLPELGATTGKRIAALAGLAPHPDQSGSADRYRWVRGGRPEVKRSLFMAALTARKHNPTLKTFYERLVANGKKPIVAVVAVMRKLVTFANAVLRAHSALEVS